MIIQSVPEGRNDSRRFVISLEEHLELVGQLAENFGNDTFEKPEPRDEFIYACRWHDRGWRDLDLNPPLNPDTGLPYNLVETPIPIIMLAGARSPEHNEAHHPYSGLIASMHVWGLYNGRYGMSAMVLIDSIPEEHRTAADAMLHSEQQRQVRLTASLRGDPKTADWVEAAALFANYKRLQFFDTLALYFNCTPEGARGEATFTHVPLSETHDGDIVIRPQSEDTYTLTPYPFRSSGLEVYFDGRFLIPQRGVESPDMAALIRDSPVERRKSVLLAR